MKQETYKEFSRRMYCGQVSYDQIERWYYDECKENRRLKKLLNQVVNAWESLKGGHNYSPTKIENWLVDKMSPVINKTRKLLRRKI